MNRLASFLLAVLCTSSLAACGGDPSADEDDQNEGALEAQPESLQIREAEEAMKLQSLQMLVREPWLGQNASARVVRDDEWANPMSDGTRKLTVVVKSKDGRYFIVRPVSTAPKASQVGKLILPPKPDESPYFMLMTPAAVTWTIANIERSPSRAFPQILEARSRPETRDSVRELGRETVDGELRTVLYFEARTYFVAARGFDERCKDFRVDECADAWLRAQNVPDSYDVKR